MMSASRRSTTGKEKGAGSAKETRGSRRQNRQCPQVSALLSKAINQEGAVNVVKVPWTLDTCFVGQKHTMYAE